MDLSRYTGGWHRLPTGRHISADHLGVLIGDAMPPGWTAHKLRHAAATNWYRHNRDLFATQQLLGHSKPETTARYVAIASDAMAAAVMGVRVPR